MRPPLSLVVLFVLTVGAPAAPLPQNRPVTDKYLLDDTDFLVVVNLRQIIASPAYKSELEKVVEGALRAEPLAATLKELSLDPAKDIDQVCMVMGRSCWPMNKGPAGPPFMVLVEGRFDPAKLQAGAKKFAKATSERGGTSIYEIAPLGSSIFAAVLDKGHVLLAPQKEQVETALDKATGKKKTGLKSKAFAELLRKIDPEKSLSLIATGDMVAGGGGSIEQGPDGKVIRRDYKLFTLGDQGIQSMQVIADTKDDIKLKVMLTATTDDKAGDLEKAIAKGIKNPIPKEFEKEFANLAQALKTVSIGLKDRTISIEGRGNGAAVQELFKALFVPRPPSREDKPKPSKNTKE